MSLLSSLLLGVIQGITEFLPISSSGHLAIARHLFHLEAEIPEFFDVLLHLGTLAAVFVAYWAEIRDMVLELIAGARDLAHGTTPQRVPPARRMILLAIVGTLPLFAVLPFQDRIETLSENLYFIGAALIVTGFLLWGCERVPLGKKEERTATLLDALLVGFGQAVATCPGISRSGMTISVGCFRGFERSFAVRFSFILSIPAILGANILSLAKAAKTVVAAEIPVYLAGVLAAAAVGYACIRLLRFIAVKGKFSAFAWYCWAVGCVTLGVTLLGG